MANRNAQVDWKAEAEKAKAMDVASLYGAIRDIRATLESADSLDRADNGNRGGFYRDQISVYRSELLSRGTDPRFI